jgi:F-type H+-transporting ATPase subunit b
MNNPLVTPDFGLIFWTSIVFIILLFILSKFAWKPILKIVKEREDFIQESIASAEKAKEELQRLKVKNEDLIKEVRAERDLLLKEANEMKEKIIADAKTKAKEESDKIITNARIAIENEKMAAVTELKNQVALLSVEIAEKILRSELAENDKQQKLMNTILDEVNLN